MDLATFIARHPGARLATRDDNERLLDFYRRMSMLGGAFDIQFLKSPDYFRFLEYEGHKHAVLIVENEDGEVEGMGSLSARPCYLGGEVAEVLHFSDLRFISAKKRKVPFDWKVFMADFCDVGAEIDQFRGCEVFLGSFVLANEYARRAFTSLETPFEISMISTYQMVSLLARRPLHRIGVKRRPDAGVTITRGTDADRVPLAKFLDGVNRQRELGFVFSGKHNELERRLAQWDGLTMGSYFIARDKAGKILGCFAPWDLTQGRRIVVDGFPFGVRQTAALLNRAGLPIPTPGDPLKILYLTSLELSLDLSNEERYAVFGALLDALYDSGEAKGYQMVSYGDYANESLLPAVKPYFITMDTPTVLYQMHRDGATRVLREQDFKVRAGHELCMT